MGFILCTTEKPSVAKEIAKVLGAYKKCNGYFEGNGYRVTWAIGHLVGLAEPNAYGYMSQMEIWNKDEPKNKEIALNQLPLIPKEFKLIILEKTKDQFEIIKKLMNDPETDEIIDCGDAGPEGCILQDFIRKKAGCNKKVKRFIATSLTEEAIRKSMSELRDIDEFTSLIKGEYCKKKADWILGMSMSRCESILYNAKIDVGRVQSPTLFFVVQRFLLSQNFVPIDYYQFQIDFLENFKCTWTKDNNNLFASSVKDKDDRLINRDFAEQIKSNLVKLKQGKITYLETKNKYTDRPQLYDLTELQRDGNRIYGYSAKQVLQTAQSLYEVYKITSYPRTDSRYLTSDLEPYLIQRINDISTINDYKACCTMLLTDGLNIDGKIIDDNKVTDHHAIICTENISNFDLSVLSEVEKNILHLIITRMIVAFSGKYLFKETIINVTFPNNMNFSAKGKIPIELGWKKICRLIAEDNEDEINKDDEQLFKDISLNQVVTIKSINILDKKTSAPTLHTQATLLTAMENAGSQIANGAILKGKGIGTPATRADIIDSIIEKKYVVEKSKGKTKYLVPTKQGINVIKVLPAELYSPKITADWETQISMIADNKLTEEEFMSNFEKFINQKINYVKSNIIKDIDFGFENKTIASCPFCHSPVYEGKFKKDNTEIDNVYCSNKECHFSIRKDHMLFKLRTGKKLTINQIKKIIENGQIEVNCISQSNKTYKAKFILCNENGYANFKIEPIKKKKTNQITYLNF